MVEKREDIEVLIARFLRGEASPEQAMELMAWRSKTSENEALYSAIEKVYHSANNTAAYHEKDINLNWENVRASVKPKGNVRPLWKRYEFYVAAAAIAVIAFLLGNLWTPNEIGGTIAEKPTKDSTTIETTHYFAEDRAETFVLKDQSNVILKQGSQLELLPGFNMDERAVKLEGSGEFEVVHDDQKPFSVLVERMKVVDIGTVFSIENFGDTVRVVVTEGEVQLQLNADVINVSAGDSAFYVISKDLIDRYKDEQQRKDTVFKFDGTELQDVAKVLSEFFNRKIVIKDTEIMKCPVSVTFRNENLATILDIISELLDIEVKRNNEIIEIYGKSCS